MKKKNHISALALATVMSFGFVAIPSEIAPTAVVEAATVLSAPEYLSYTSTSDSITLKWDKVTGADAYRVFMYNSKTKKFEKYKDVKSAVCSVTGLDKGKKYNFKVAALKKSSNGYDAGKLSETFSASVMMCIPGLFEGGYTLGDYMENIGYEKTVSDNSIQWQLFYDGKNANNDLEAFSNKCLKVVKNLELGEHLNNGYSVEIIKVEEIEEEGSHLGGALSEYKVYYDGIYVGNLRTKLHSILRYSGKKRYVQSWHTVTFKRKDGVQFWDEKKRASSSKHDTYIAHTDYINMREKILGKDAT